MYGWRGRIGLLVPSINTTMEPEFWRLAPEGVSVHSARIAGGRKGTPEELRGMRDEAVKAAERIANVSPDVVVYGCTSGSFFEGAEWNSMIREKISEITGVPTVTTTSSMVDCLRAAGHSRIDLVTPYVELTNERLKAYLREAGIEVAELGTFDMLDMFDHAAIMPQEIYRLSRETRSEEASATFIACTQLRALEVLDKLERDLRRPIFSAVQTSAWAAFREMGVALDYGAGGALLRDLSEPDLPSAHATEAPGG